MVRTGSQGTTPGLTFKEFPVLLQGCAEPSSLAEEPTRSSMYEPPVPMHALTNCHCLQQPEGKVHSSVEKLAHASSPGACYHRATPHSLLRTPCLTWKRCQQHSASVIRLLSQQTENACQHAHVCTACLGYKHVPSGPAVDLGLQSVDTCAYLGFSKKLCDDALHLISPSQVILRRIQLSIACPVEDRDYTWLCSSDSVCCFIA